jgi:hypothetical protein
MAFTQRHSGITTADQTLIVWRGGVVRQAHDDLSNNPCLPGGH